MWIIFISDTIRIIVQTSLLSKHNNDHSYSHYYNNSYRNNIIDPMRHYSSHRYIHLHYRETHIIVHNHKTISYQMRLQIYRNSRSDNSHMMNHRHSYNIQVITIFNLIENIFYLELKFRTF